MASTLIVRSHRLGSSIGAVILLGATSMLITALPFEDAQASPLDCSAFDDQGYGNESLGHTVTASNPSEAPSDAPSAAPLCSDRLSNARGSYTSSYAPCTVKFHSITQFQREGEEKEEEIEYIDYRTSNLCRDDNVIVEIKEYLDGFPDECIADFERCYSLEHHSKYLYPFMCVPQELPSPDDNLIKSISYRSRWELPPGTSHVSVDCTEDRKFAREEIAGRYEEARRHSRQARREEIGMKLFNVMLVVVSSVAFIYALSTLIVAPLVTLASSAREQRRRRRRRSSCRSSTRSRTVRTSSTLSSSLGTLPTHHQENMTLIVANPVVVDGSPEESNIDARQDSIDRLEDYDDSGDSSDSLYSFETISDDEQQRLNEFDSQVPCDFDAVPIVAATILPPTTDVITATVVDDGISYS